MDAEERDRGDSGFGRMVAEKRRRVGRSVILMDYDVIDHMCLISLAD